MKPAQFKPLLMPAYIGACLLLGGASAAGFAANLLLELAAIALIIAALLKPQEPPLTRPAAQLALLPGLILLLALIQLVPLPPAIWSHLPGRGAIAVANALVGPLPWEPISLTPRFTIASTIWLLPSVAVLLGLLRLRWFRPGWIAWTIIGIAAASVALGAAQRATSASDPDGVSPFYLYDFTSFGSGVGFFANANHMATLMLASMPFLVAIHQSAPRGSSRRKRRSGLPIVLGAIALMLAVGLLLNGSLAGFGLLLPVAAASAMLASARNAKPPRWQFLAIAGVVAIGVAGVLLAPLGNNLTSAPAGNMDVSRATTFRVGLHAARDFAPLGSGIGSFRAIYHRYEDPAQVSDVFINHVHSDYIEVALETGLPGLTILALFLLWWVRRAAAVWLAADPDPYARAATIASAAIMAHSAVDYPLRTAAIGAVLATCCALMARPRPISTGGATAAGGRRARHISAD